MNEENEHTVNTGTVTIPEAAKLLGVARSTVYQLIEWEELDAIRVRSALRVDIESLERFRASGKIP